jgi:antirestriction protein ArdC
MANTKKTAYTPTTEAVSIEEKITNLFIDGLNSGIVAWQKPWIRVAIGNVATGNTYTGGNAFWAALHARLHGVQANYATILGAATKLGYKAKGKGWVNSKGEAVEFPIKKGAKGLHLIRVVRMEKELKNAEGQPILGDDGKPKKFGFPIIKGFCVFSIDHLNWDLSKYVQKVADHQPMENGDTIVKNYVGCPEIKVVGNVACYYPTLDRIEMPSIKQFKMASEYYHTLFHELVHSTGHADRLNRANFYSDSRHDYSFEELVAEIGAGMLCDLSCVPLDFENSPAYLNGWIKKLSLEPKWILLHD